MSIFKKTHAQGAAYLCSKSLYVPVRGLIISLNPT